MATAMKLRETITTYCETVELTGRNALYALMADVYKLYCEVKQSSDKGKQFKVDVQVALKRVGVQLRENSSDTNNLVRYVGKNFTDKQVSVRGRSLAIALKRKIEPADYIKFIRESNGFDGVVGDKIAPTEAALAKVAEEKKAALQKTFNLVKKEKGLGRLTNISWTNGDQDYKILFAVRNDDNTASLKDAMLSDTSLTTVLNRYANDLRDRNKPSNTEELAAKKENVKILKAQLSGKDAAIEVTKAELDLAIASNDAARRPALLQKLMLLELEAKSLRTSYTELKNDPAFVLAA